MLTVAEDTNAFAGADAQMWRVGFALLDAQGRFVRADQHAEPGAYLACNVAGVSYRLDAVQDGGFSVLSPVLLRPEPTNPHDANAVGVWDRTGTLKAGFVPRTLSRRVASWVREEGPLGGAVLAEFRRDSSQGQRVGLMIAIAPIGELELAVVAPTRNLEFGLTVTLDVAEAGGLEARLNVAEPPSDRRGPRRRNASPGEPPASPSGAEARSRRTRHERQIPPLEPIRLRVAALRRVWMEIDELNAVAELRGGRPTRVSWAHRSLSGYSGFADIELLPLLSGETRLDVERLWGTETEPEHLSRIVSSRQPLANLLGALVPALNVWDVLLDEAWRMARRYPGPGGAVTFEMYQPWLSELESIGARIDDDVIDEILRQDEMRTLVPPTPPIMVVGDRPHEPGGAEPTVTFPDQISPEGEHAFIQLRDLITRRRREWADANLDQFLERAWRTRVERLAVEHEERVATRGRARAKLMRRDGIDFVNHWLGGQATPLYELIGHPRHVRQVQSQVATGDIGELVELIRTALNLPPPEQEIDWATVSDMAAVWEPIADEIERRITEVKRSIELGKDPRVTKRIFRASEGDDARGQIARALGLSTKDAWLRLTDSIVERLPAPTQVTH